MAERFRVTYATMSADNEELHQAYEKGVEEARAAVPMTIPVIVNGEERTDGQAFEIRSPNDRDLLLATVHSATAKDVNDAVAAAKAAALEWDRMGWQRRCDIIERVADLISERTMMLAALLSMEVGKTRLEALGDVAETADLMRWNAKEMRDHDGFRTPMDTGGASGDFYDVLRPYGVWAVISPFNFPMALAGGPSSGALVAGNTVVFKPSRQGTVLGYQLARAYLDAGVPAGAFHFLPGGGSAVGETIVRHPQVDGITFTGSYEVGMGIYRSFPQDHPKPIICEMGGKNPTIVSDKADLEKATDGVLRSAFGFGGQKCSAASRVYVQRDIYEPFVEMLRMKTEALGVGDPLQRGNFMGPVINDAAVKTYEEAVEEARKNGKVITGGHRLTEGDLARGKYVAPTVVEAPVDNWLFKRELFVPLVAVAPVDDIDEGIALANDTQYGLTAGFFSEDAGEQQEFLDRIQAGVVYVNRRAGATTGAWPGVQPFGGWKASGTTGKASGGPYYVTQYLREQSRTVMTD